MVCNEPTIKFFLARSLIRSLRPKKGFFDISECKIPTDNEIPGFDGVLINAKWYSNEEIADLLTELEEYDDKRLESVELSLREWIDIRRSRSRKARGKPKQFQKQEIVK